MMSMHLSDKAKGKRRASDPGAGQILSRPQLQELTVRFTDGVADLTIHVAEKDTVRVVKQSVSVFERYSIRPLTASC